MDVLNPEESVDMLNPNPKCFISVDDAVLQMHLHTRVNERTRLCLHGSRGSIV